MLLAKSLPRMDSLPHRKSRMKSKPKSPQPEWIGRFTHLRNGAYAGEGQVRVVTGACGVPIEVADGSHILKPTVISESYFSGMMAGKLPTPEWRIGEMVAIVEYIAAIRLMQIRSGHPDAKFFAELLKTFPNALGWFIKQPQYRVWIERFRYAIYNRAKLDRGKSAYDEAIYRTYSEYLKRADGQMDDEVTKSEKPGEAGDDATT
jgi:hypothetical protein